MIRKRICRFSEDLDFTLDSERPEDDVLLQLVESLNRDHYGINFVFDEYYKTDGDTSFGGDARYHHAWNDSGRFRLQVSLRERPTLPATPMAMKHQAYFHHLEIDLLDVRSLQAVEMIAEKIRAAYQRAKVRDLYDLHCFATRPIDGELLRRLVVLKLWQVRDPFEPDVFFEKLRGGGYDWEDLRRLVRASEQNEPLAERLRAEIRELAAG
ncbi:MAG: nucleotidyl transferase AbiEii/AbiGii toxin family protein [Candidatus Eisenbacteria sp.]|nr:nucleotidyl transferase AbiEii/AbiGii toxin family protein [Candidatus Eisenbacteria bacterium]